jgi:GNAT superfamily N-acetyltransferase
LLNSDKSGAFNSIPDHFEDLYVKRNADKAIIAGTAFYILHIDTVRVCYVEAIAVREDYKNLGVGSQMVSLLKECLRSFRG